MMVLLVLSFISVLVNGLNTMLGIVFLIMLSLCSVVLLKHDFGLFLVYSGWVCDSVSYSLVLLSIWISVLMLMSMVFLDSSFCNKLSVVIVSLMFVLIGAFVVSDYVFFYILFEACLIPTFVLILGWGYQPERVQAGIYMLLYTVFGSLPLLLVLVLVSGWSGSSSVVCFFGLGCVSWCGWLMCIFGLLAFLIKLPMYFVHLWLPKAHVEAPVGGSMVLAGVLLKLGGYGMYRVLPIFYGVSIFLLSGIIVWGLWGGLVISLLCLYQVDVKFLIALSSVAHMSFVLGSILVQSKWGVNGAMLIMIGHGFCSSGLFCVANMVYSRSQSRSIGVLNSLKVYFPSAGMLWFLLVSSNMSAPPSLSLIGEIMSITVLGNWSFFVFPLLFCLVFFSAAYSLFLYEGSMHGWGSSSLGGVFLLSVRELNILVLHWLPLNLMFLFIVEIFL